MGRHRLSSLLSVLERAVVSFVLWGTPLVLIYAALPSVPRFLAWPWLALTCVWLSCVPLAAVSAFVRLGRQTADSAAATIARIVLLLGVVALPMTFFHAGVRRDPARSPEKPYTLEAGLSFGSENPGPQADAEWIIGGGRPPLSRKLLIPVVGAVVLSIAASRRIGTRAASPT